MLTDSIESNSLHRDCGCSVPLPIFHIFLGGTQNFYLLVSPYVLYNQCKVWTATIYQPLEGLDCRLIYRSADCQLKDPVELFGIIYEKRMSVWKSYGLLPCYLTRQSWLWAVQYKSGMGHNTPPIRSDHILEWTLSCPKHLTRIYHYEIIPFGKGVGLSYIWYVCSHMFDPQVDCLLLYFVIFNYWPTDLCCHQFNWHWLVVSYKFRCSLQAFKWLDWDCKWILMDNIGRIFRVCNSVRLLTVVLPLVPVIILPLITVIIPS